jgi:hypothetical protein
MASVDVADRNQPAFHELKSESGIAADGFAPESCRCIR